MYNSFPIAKTKVEPWYPLEPNHPNYAKQPLPDLALALEFYNYSSYWLLVVNACNEKFVVPPRELLLGSVQRHENEFTDHILIRRNTAVRSEVKLYDSEVSHVDSAFNDQDVIGCGKRLVSWKKRSLPDRSSRQMFHRKGDRDNSRFPSEDDYVDTMHEQFKLTMNDEHYDKPVYVASMAIVVVKLSGEPTSDEIRNCNHPIFIGKVKREQRRGQLGRDVHYAWTPPYDSPNMNIWINVGGRPVAINPEAGSVGAPGLTISLAGENPFHIPYDEIKKDPTKQGVFFTQESALHWRDPVERDAQKNKFDIEKHDRTEAQTQAKVDHTNLEFLRDEISRSNAEHAEAMKRQRDDHLAELKARDEAAKREREKENDERQRKVDIWKAAAAITAGVISMGLALIKIVEKIAGK